jgi:hypothetical protein
MSDYLIQKLETTKAADGRQKHMAVDGDLHAFLRKQAIVENRSFRDFGNRLLRIAIKKYIADNKLDAKAVK